MYSKDFVPQMGLLPRSTDKKFPMMRDGHTEYRTICHKLTGVSSPYIQDKAELGYRFRCGMQPNEYKF